MRVVVRRGIGHMDSGLRKTVMSIRADTHLFGSKEGYCTLAYSAGVDPAESDELSMFGFGQTGSSSYLDALAAEPSAYGRQLQSGRVGITRCLRGHPDDAGRPTLLLCTLLIAPQDYEGLLQRGLESVINDPSIWELACFESGEQIAIRPMTAGPPRSVQRNDLGVLDAWLISQLNRGSVSAFSHERKTAETVLAFPQVLETNDRLRYRWGVNLLSGDAPVDVCTLSTSAKQSGRRKVYRFEPDESIRNEVVRFLRDGIETGTLRELPSLTSMLQRNHESATVSQEPPCLNQEAATDVPTRSSHRRRVMTAVAISFAGVAVVVGVLTLGTSIFRRDQDSVPEQVPPIENAFAMDTSRKERNKQEEPVEPTLVKPKPQPADIERVDTAPALSESPTESEDRPGDEKVETVTRDEFNTDDADITSQADRPRGIVDVESLDQLEEDDETPDPTKSDLEPLFKEMSTDELALWFVKTRLPKPHESGGPPLFDDDYGQEHLRQYVAALEAVRKREENLKDRRRLDPNSHDVKTDLSTLRITLENEAENIQRILGEYIAYLQDAFGKRAKAPSMNHPDWRSISALTERLNLNQSLTGDAELCVRCTSVMQYFVREILSGRSTELKKIVNGWHNDLGSKNPSKGLLGELSENKELLDKRIKRRKDEQEKLEIRVGSRDGQPDC